MSDSEEEILVVVEFCDPVPGCSDKSKIKMVGLDTDMPIVQYEKQVFKGEWKDCAGTKMFFTEKSKPEALDPAFSPQLAKQYECAFTARKLLLLKSVILKTKEEAQELNDAEESSDVEISNKEESFGDSEVMSVDEPGPSGHNS